jgi:hypothetical protein
MYGYRGIKLALKLSETIDVLIEKYEELGDIDICTIDSSTHDVQEAYTVYVVKDKEKHFILISPIDLVGKGIFLGGKADD